MSISGKIWTDTDHELLGQCNSAKYGNQLVVGRRENLLLWFPSYDHAEDVAHPGLSSLEYSHFDI